MVLRKIVYNPFAVVTLIAFFFFAAGCNSGADLPEENQAETPGEQVEPDADPFLGMWALDLDYESSNAGWLEVRQEEGYLDADLLWRWGSVHPVEFVFVPGGELYITEGRDIVRETDPDGDPLRTQHYVYWLSIEKVEKDSIAGMASFPGENGLGITTVAFSGKRLPPVGEAPDLDEIEYGEPVSLFNGEDLTGWELVNDQAASGWEAVDGVLVNDPVQEPGKPHKHYGNLRTEDTFKDFNLKIDVNVPEGSNSGIYLRGVYEIQVFDSYGKEPDSHHMGALYSRIAPSVSAERPAGEWQEFDITLYDRHLTVVLNGTTIIDNQAVKGITGGALTWNEFQPGPIFLQGDHGAVKYRDIVLTPIVN